MTLDGINVKIINPDIRKFNPYPQGTIVRVVKGTRGGWWLEYEGSEILYQDWEVEVLNEK